MKTLKILFRSVMIVLVTSLLFSQACNAKDMDQGDDPPLLNIHYLGHSAFVLQFDNGISVVCDYGHYNAWAPAWDSPIHDIGDLIPDVMTYSHFHEDHYDPDRIPEGVQYILSESDSLEIDGLKIVPIRVCEYNINNEDNSAYLFTYKSKQFLHLGDAQAQIMNIENVEVQEHISAIIPDSLDMLFMTIEGMQQFIEEAEIFVDLLKPKRIIPMHYWSMEYKQDFLSYLSTQDSLGIANYTIIDTLESKYEIFENDIPAPVKVVSLVRSPFEQTTSIEQSSDNGTIFSLEQNYPNPFNSQTTIRYSIFDESQVKLKIYDAVGHEVAVLIDRVQIAGVYEVVLNANKYQRGVYYFLLQIGNQAVTGKMLKLR